MMHPRPTKRVISKALQESARGRRCSVRWPRCDGGGETTVLAHLRLPGNAGVGRKPDDFMAVFSCGPCHDHIDGRQHPRVPEAELLRALQETWSVWVEEGLLFVKGAKT